jgi:hypothetical protein
MTWHWISKWDRLSQQYAWCDMSYTRPQPEEPEPNVESSEEPEPNAGLEYEK